MTENDYRIMSQSSNKGSSGNSNLYSMSDVGGGSISGNAWTDFWVRFFDKIKYMIFEKDLNDDDLAYNYEQEEKKKPNKKSSKDKKASSKAEKSGEEKASSEAEKKDAEKGKTSSETEKTASEKEKTAVDKEKVTLEKSELTGEKSQEKLTKKVTVNKDVEKTNTKENSMSK